MFKSLAGAVFSVASLLGVAAGAQALSQVNVSETTYGSLSMGEAIVFERSSSETSVPILLVLESTREGYLGSIYSTAGRGASDISLYNQRALLDNDTVLYQFLDRRNRNFAFHVAEATDPTRPTVLVYFFEPNNFAAVESAIARNDLIGNANFTGEYGGTWNFFIYDDCSLL